MFEFFLVPFFIITGLGLGLLVVAFSWYLVNEITEIIDELHSPEIHDDVSDEAVAYLVSNNDNEK